MEGNPNTTIETDEGQVEPNLRNIEICLAMIAAASRDEPVSSLDIAVELGLVEQTTDESCNLSYTPNPKLTFKALIPVYAAVDGLRGMGYQLNYTRSPTITGYCLADEPFNQYSGLPEKLSELIRILDILDYPLTAAEITGLIYGVVERSNRQYVSQRLKELCERGILDRSLYEGPTINGKGKGGNPRYVYSVNTEYLQAIYFEPYIGNLSIVNLAWIHYVYENIIAPTEKKTIKKAPHPQTRILLEQTVKQIILKLNSPKNSHEKSELSKNINRVAWSNLWKTYHENITVGDNNINGKSKYDPYIIGLIYYYFDLHTNYSIREDALYDNFLTSRAKNEEMKRTRKPEAAVHPLKPTKSR